jgi:AAA+ superfamily predicted ATPase
MEEEINKILRCIDEISEKGLKSKFSEEFQKSVSKQSKVVSEYLGITSERQSIWFSILFSMSLQRSSIDLEDISRYLNTTIVKILQYQVDFDQLVKLKVLRREKPDRRRRNNPDRLTSLCLYVPSDIIISLTNGDKKLPSRTKQNLNTYEILDVVLNIIQEKESDLIDSNEMSEEIQNLLNENTDCPFVHQINKYKLPILDQIILLCVCIQFTESITSVDLLSLLKTILNDTSSQLRVRKDFLQNRTKLQKLELVDLEMETFRSDKYVELLPKGKTLFGEDQNLFNYRENKDKKDIILSTGISEQKLFFNEKEQKSIDFLTDLLKPDNFSSVVNRLKDSGLKIGLPVLLYGSPGTGKTETVYQISRKTGRDIKMVDMSQTKSMWFGESEKLIKKVFDSYKKLVETSELTPILLFNEVDGIFGTRKTVGNSSVDQTQNTIQNILLQEMEDFNYGGILLSTTNLPENLKDFERRFLYKIQYDKPDSNTRFLIWKDKLPILTDDEILSLSQNFELSGGQIQNLKKKITLTQILTGITPQFQEIQELCESEFLNRISHRNKIGFKIGSV